MEAHGHGRGSERWSALEIRLLIAFVAVVDAGSFTGAARALGYTQSGVSQQIAALERIVERKLLVRESGGRRPIELTPEGESLLLHARILLGQLDHAYDAVVAHEREAAATVGLSSIPSTTVYLVPPIERALRAEGSPRLDLHETLHDDESLALLESQHVELALVTVLAAGPFAFEELGTDPYVVAVSSDSALAERRRVGIDDLRGLPLVGLRPSAHEELVEARLVAAGLDPAAFRRYDNNRLIQTLVRSNDAVAIVPSMTLVGNDESVCILEPAVDLPPRTIALASLRDALLSPAARRFKQLALPIWRHILAGTPHAWERAAS